MTAWRFWLRGERDETDKEALAINLYNDRRKTDPRLRGAPRGDRMSRRDVRDLPEALMVEIVETYATLISWGVEPGEALARIENYRAPHFGSDARRIAVDLEGYLRYRLAIEALDWPNVLALFVPLIKSGADRCTKYFSKNPPDVMVTALVGTDGIGLTITSAALLAPVDNVASERDAVSRQDRLVLDNVLMYQFNGDQVWRFFHNVRGAHWVYQGYALVRGGEVVKAVASSVSEFRFGPAYKV